jgi:hypothetical protein
VKGLDCSGVDRDYNNKALELWRRCRAEATENKAVFEKRERSILVCVEIVETEGYFHNSHSPFRFMQGIEGKLAFAGPNSPRPATACWFPPVTTYNARQAATAAHGVRTT